MSYAFQQIKYYITNPKHKYLSEEVLRRWPISTKMMKDYILTAQLEGFISRKKTKNGYKCYLKRNNENDFELLPRIKTIKKGKK